MTALEILTDAVPFVFDLERGERLTLRPIAAIACAPDAYRTLLRADDGRLVVADISDDGDSILHRFGPCTMADAVTMAEAVLTDTHHADETGLVKTLALAVIVSNLERAP